VTDTGEIRLHPADPRLDLRGQEPGRLNGDVLGRDVCEDLAQLVQVRSPALGVFDDDFEAVQQLVLTLTQLWLGLALADPGGQVARAREAHLELRLIEPVREHVAALQQGPSFQRVPGRAGARVAGARPADR
jgi:hypothetical protein